MSSKRKNTPTKLPRDDVVNERQLYNNLPQEKYNYETDIDYQPPLHIVENNENFNGVDNQDSDSSNDRDRPRNKKQRILQSIRNSSDSESDPESNHFLLNNNTTKPGFGLHKKSMESVLQRLNTHKPGSVSEREYLDKCLKMTAQEASADMQLFTNIQQLLSDQTVQDKEKKIGDMIAQLQNLKECIRKEKQVSNS